MQNSTPQLLPIGIGERFQRFFQMESASGILLLLCAIVALIWANSPAAESYHELWHHHLVIGLDQLNLRYDLHTWINDGLMVIFFFVVGLEIKREFLVGELNDAKKAALPIIGAAGGMLVPALIYTAFNNGTPAIHGWGVPVATDIAFALTILSLLGKRVPLGLKVFLAALAIVDDLGAVVVIAIFYTDHLNFIAMGLAVLGLGILMVFNRMNVIRPEPYAIVGVMVWLAVLQSGVHATIAGVLIALTIPATSRIDVRDFRKDVERLYKKFLVVGKKGQLDRLTHEQQDIVSSMVLKTEEVQAPLERFEHALQPFVSFVIMPLFALSNAGVHIHGSLAVIFSNPVSLGAFLGLLLGKVTGVFGASMLSIKLGLASMPRRVTMLQFFGTAIACGIGFTMSLFIANLAYDSQEHIDDAKIGVLAASAIAGIVSYFVIRAGSREVMPQDEHSEDAPAHGH
ncbi:MAG: Na+/H+ antiporter NhaA [bacterium]